MLPILNVSYWVPPPLSLTEHFRPEHVTQTGAKKWTPHTRRKIFSRKLLCKSNKHNDNVKFAFFIVIMRRGHKRRFSSFSRLYFFLATCTRNPQKSFIPPLCFELIGSEEKKKAGVSKLFSLSLRGI